MNIYRVGHFPLNRSIAIALLVVWIVTDGIVISRYCTDELENRDSSSGRVVAIGNMLAWVIGIGMAFASAGAIANRAIPWIGLAMMAAGIVLRFVAIAQLGRLHTPNLAIRSDHQLLEHGLYRHIRHPSYLGGLIAFAGFGLALGNWISEIVIVVLAIVVYVYRIGEEEAALTDAFGNGYRDYCRRTWRLLPWVY